MLDLRLDQRAPTGDHRPVICLLVDVANIPEDAILPLVQELRRRGNVAAMFGFADWHRRDMHLRHRLLDALGFLCVHGGSWDNGSGGLKSLVDSIMKRAIKWMPQWFPNCDTYVLATGDRDFAHDASDLRWRGFQVWIAAGEASINNELRLGADEFINLDRLPNKVAPSQLLGVPTNYYESTYGFRRPGRPGGGYSSGRSASAPADRAEPATEPPAMVQPAPAQREAPARESAPALRVAPVPAAPRPAMVASPPAVAGDDQALLERIRQLAGERGHVPQREALRALAPAEDPGGRERSRLSNQIRDLVERNLLVRSQTSIGGNLTQVLALAGATIATPVATPTPEAAVDVERQGRGRRRRPRPDMAGEELEVQAEPTRTIMTEPVVAPPVAPRVERPVAPPIEIAPAQPAAMLVAEAPVARPVAPSVEATPARPAAVLVPETPPAPIASPAEALPPVVPRPAVAPTAREVERRPVEGLRPERLRAQRPAEPREAASATAAPRPSWRESVAQALAQVRGELGLAPLQPAAAPVSATAITVSEASSVQAPAVAEVPAPTPDEPVDTAPRNARGARPRRRPQPTSGGAAESPVVQSETAVAQPGNGDNETTGASDEPEVRRRPARRRRRPTGNGTGGDGLAEVTTAD